MNNEIKQSGRSLIGEVISDKMNKSIVVLVVRKVRHPMYGKYIKRNSKLHAHDENNQCKVGDKVRIHECRPIAKTKAWTLAEIIGDSK